MRRFLIAATAGFAILAFAAPGASQTLEETLATAYQSNPVLAAERARQRQTDERLVQARSARLPSLSAGASASESERWGGSSFLTGSGDGSVDYSVSANQSLYRGGRTSGAIDQATAFIDAGRAGLLSTEQTILLDAVGAHMDVLRDQQVIAIRRNNVEVLSEQLRAARDRFEVGEITRTDVAQAEARVSGARAQLSAAQAALAASRASYERVVGNVPGELTAPSGLPEAPSSFADAVIMAQDMNPQLLAAQFNELAAERGIEVARGALRPEVSLQARASESRESDFSGQGTGSASLTAQLSVPIFTGGLNRSRVREAVAASDQARLQVTVARRQVIEGVTNAWNGLLAAQAVIESSREAVRANEIAFEGVEQEAFVGLRTTLDVLNAEQELLNSRLELVRAERDLFVASYALLQSMGLLSAEQLALPVEIYQPETASDAALFTNFDLTPWN
ncbi:MAG: TolC family outer membrane protein [Pseudomonadota bacterium]